MAAALEKALREVDALIARLTLQAERAPSLPSTASKAPAHQQQAARLVPGAIPTGQAEKRLTGVKAEKVAVKPNTQQEPSLAESLSKARLAVGVVQQVEELPNSDKLYRCKVQVAEGETRQIIAGLRKHIDRDQLEGRLVVVILNLKTAKLAGEASEGMILAAVQRSDQYMHGEVVRPLVVPDGCKAGDAVFLEGSQPADVYPKEFKHWKKMLPHLVVKESSATFDNVNIVTRNGPIRVDDCLPDGATIS